VRQSSRAAPAARSAPCATASGLQPPFLQHRLSARRADGRRSLPGIRRRIGRALAQPVLVAADVFLNSSVALERERARDDVVEKRAIVTDEEQRSRPLDELFFEQFERLEIEIVGRLVENQDVGRPGQQARQKQPVSFAAREGLDRRLRPFRREQKSWR
jgi:hypothetical protein